MTEYTPSKDPHYWVEGIPAPLRRKITELIRAAEDAAFAGAMEPSDAEATREYLHEARRRLETKIKHWQNSR